MKHSTTAFVSLLGALMCVSVNAAAAAGGWSASEGRPYDVTHGFYWTYASQAWQHIIVDQNKITQDTAANGWAVEWVVPLPNASSGSSTLNPILFAGQCGATMNSSAWVNVYNMDGSLYSSGAAVALPTTCGWNGSAFSLAPVAVPSNYSVVMRIRLQTYGMRGQYIPMAWAYGVHV